MKRWAGALVTLTVIAAVVWFQAGPREAPLATSAGETSYPPGAPPGEDPTAAPDPAFAVTHSIPDQLPAFSLQDRDGHTTPISNWRGKSLIINFWATWCAPCRREMPLLQALDRDWAGRDFRVIGVAVDQRDSVIAYANSLQIAYPLLIGDQDALDVVNSLGVNSPGFPFTVFTDRRQRIVALYVGELHKAQTDLILSAVRQVNENQLALTEARKIIGDGLAKLRETSSV